MSVNLRPSASSAPVYLDHAATTPMLAEAIDALLPWLRDEFGNPSA
jgi:cysteine desulfurase